MPHVLLFKYKHWNLWCLLKRISIFSLLEKNFHLIHEDSVGIALYKHMRNTWVVQWDDGHTHSGVLSIPAIFVAAITAAAALFTKLNWSVKKKVNFHLVNYSFVKLLLIFFEGTEPLSIFAIDFNSNLIIANTAGVSRAAFLRVLRAAFLRFVVSGYSPTQNLLRASRSVLFMWIISIMDVHTTRN